MRSLTLARHRKFGNAKWNSRSVYVCSQSATPTKRQAGHPNKTTSRPRRKKTATTKSAIGHFCWFLVSDQQTGYKHPNTEFSMSNSTTNVSTQQDTCSNTTTSMNDEVNPQNRTRIKRWSTELVLSILRFDDQLRLDRFRQRNIRMKPNAQESC